MILLSGHSLTPERRVPLEALSLELKERESTANMTPADMTGISVNSWFKDDVEPGAGIVWRVKSLATTFQTETPTVQLEHVINTLRDKIMFGEVTAATITGSANAERCTAEQAVRYILRQQGDWVLGTFGYSVSNPYKFDGETLFDALEIVTNSLLNACWTYDLTVYPFKLNIVPIDTSVDSELRAGRNLTAITRTIDKSALYTRFFPIGYDDLHIDGDCVQKNVNLYGAIDHVETDTSIESKSELVRWANERLENHCEPTVTIEVEGFELASATGESLDRLTLGRVCRVPLPEYGTTIQERIVALSYPDKVHQPEVFKATLANNRNDVTKIIADAIKGGVSGKGGRTSAKQSKEDHAWIEDTEDHVALCAESIIGEGDDMWRRLSEIVVDGEGIHQRVTRNEGDIVTAFTQIDMNEQRILLEAQRATAAEGQLSGRITVEADRITQEVIQRKAGQEELSARITVTASQIRQEVKDTKNSLSSQIVQTASQIRHEVSDTKNSLNSRITQTASQIRQEVSDTKNSLSSSITQTASQIRAEVKDTKNHLESSITQTASQIRSEVRDGINGVNSSITQTASQIRSEVRDSINGVNSSITQTASQIRSEVSNSINGVNSSITQTASQIRSEVNNSINGVNSSITQTASQIRGEVNDAVNGVNSSITQTASQIRQEVSDTKNGLQASITTNADNIELKVSKNGVISSINQTSESVTINASKINLIGYVSTTSLATDLGNLAQAHINTLYVDTNIYGPNGNSLYALGLMTITLEGPVSNVYTLKQTTLNGTESTIGTFSRATTLSGVWSGRNYTVTASPQGNIKQGTVYDGIVYDTQGETTKSGKWVYHDFIVYSDDGNGEADTQIMKKNCGIDASSVYTDGQNHVTLEDPTWNAISGDVGTSRTVTVKTTGRPTNLEKSVALSLSEGNWVGTGKTISLKHGSTVVAKVVVGSPWIIYNDSGTVDQGTLAAGKKISLKGGDTVLGTWQVPSLSLESKTITSNGTYTPGQGYDGFDEVTVNVHPNVYALKCTGATQQGGVVTYTFTTSGGSFSTGTTYNFWR